MIEFHEPGEPRVRVCYRYTFNMAKNLRPGSSCPATLRGHIDIVLHAFPGEHFRELFLRRTGAPPHLSTILVSVVNVWEGHLTRNWRATTRRRSGRTCRRGRTRATAGTSTSACRLPDLEVQAGSP